MSDASLSAAALIDEPALLAQERGFARLRFSDQLEPGFQLYLHAKMCARVKIVATSSIAFMLFFMLLDYLYLPHWVSSYTLSVRSAGLIVIVLAIWYANREGRVAPHRAFAVATVGYFCSGLMVAMVIIVARLAEVPIRVTHDGLYLVLLSGMFLLALPMRQATIGSCAIVVVYLLAECCIGSSRSTVVSNSIFLINFTLMGAFGAYLYEYMQRRAYLNEQLLEAARTRAERESQSKTRFLATASHDLRQPLHAMSLFIQHLYEQVDNPETSKTVARLADSTQLLQVMLNSLLDISRLSVGMVRAQIRSFNLQPWLQQLLDSLEPFAARRNIVLRLRCNKAYAVYSDPLLLERLIRNYLNNALIHAEARTVSIEVTRVDQRLRISVVDDGCGLAEADQERIYEEFTQLRNPARSLDKGVGLGLSICRQIVHLLEYPSGLESRVGEGSRFWFDAPLGEWQAQTETPQQRQAPELSGRVALIENDRVSREAMQALLSAWGCIVWAFEGADEALAGLRGIEVDVLLTDYRLEGDIDGLMLVRALRDQAVFAGPAALVTADTADEVIEAARLADVELLYKPVLPARLRRVVHNLLAVRC
ncbi:MAG: hybrid sensor histidine kinase/response regulator [Halopseudomonas sp.]|uniref:ATP-binding response regulator n=1 Tax=Halopseudomonas sp. TaxID=2901191 RepID=UPI00300192DC